MFEKILAKRIKELPPYLFAELDFKREAVRARGVDIIDLGVGDPDRPTPPHIVEAMQREVANAKNHRYPSYQGLLAFREAVSQWYKGRFGVKLDPKTEIVSLIGAKEGIAHFPLAFINPGDVTLAPSPAYPVYKIGTQFAGGTAHIMPLRKENGFLPDLDAIPKKIADKAKVIFINYPNNPTGAIANRAFFKKVVAFAKAHSIIVAHDAPYSEMYYDEKHKPMSFLEVPGARDVGVEFHSLSKTYQMTGWRIGFAVGNAEIIAALGKVKTNIDSGLFEAVQRAGIVALTGDQKCTNESRAIYLERRDALVEGLSEAGIKVAAPKATFYVFAPTPFGMKSADFCGQILDEAGVVTTPGVGFGAEGEGYFRCALTVSVNRIKEATARIKVVMSEMK